MDYEKKYKEALAKARNIVNSINVGLIGKDSFEAVFPELIESEDERIKKAIIERIQNWGLNSFGNITKEEALSWLEKQGEQKTTISDEALREGILKFGITQYQIDNWLKKHINVVEQKPADKIEPKFHEGEWVVIKQ